MGFLDFFTGLREARSGLYARPEVIETLAEKRLRFIVDEAYRRVPYYANVFRSRGITSHDVRSFNDLRKLPILNKRDVQENYSQLINQDLRPDQRFRKSTSGSTGEPVDCLHDLKGWYRSEGIALRGQIQGGLKMKHRVALVVPPPSMGTNRLYKILSKLGRLKYTSVLDDVTVTLRSLRSFKPHVLKTYPSFLRAAIETGSVPSCELIFSLSELLDANLRMDIEAALRSSEFAIVRATLLASPFRPVFDLVIDASTVDHMPLRLRKLWLSAETSVLKPHGILLVSFDCRLNMFTELYHRFFTRKIYPEWTLTPTEVRGQLESLGFSILREHAIFVAGFIWGSHRPSFILTRLFRRRGVLEFIKNRELSRNSKWLSFLAPQYVIVAMKMPPASEASSQAS